MAARPAAPLLHSSLIWPKHPSQAIIIVISDMMQTLTILFISLALLPLPAFGQECNGNLGGDILGTGSFGQGGGLFSGIPAPGSNLSFQGSYPDAAGEYAIVQSTANAPGSLCTSPFSDSGGQAGGYFMMAIPPAAPQTCFSQTVEVCDGLVYTLKMSLANLSAPGCGAEPGALSISLHGIGQYEVSLPNSGLPWQEWALTFAVPTGTNLISLSVSTTASTAATFGLDDIVLAHCSPIISLPDTLSFCGGEALLSPAFPEGFYPSPFFQWQRSFDGGASWSNIPNAQSGTLLLSNPVPGLRYRLTASNSPLNYASPSCRTVSNPVLPIAQLPAVIYSTPVICEGDTLQVQGQQLTQAGPYSIPVPGQTGCDTLLEILLFTNPAFDIRFGRELCLGDSILGQPVYADTSLSLFLSTAEGCDSVITYIVDVVDTLVLSISGDTASCAGTAVTWQAPAGYNSYNWSTGSTSATTSLSESGTYGLTVTSAAGCEQSLSQDYYTSAPVAETEAFAPSCPGEADGQIALIEVSGGIPPYNLALNTAAGQPISPNAGLHAGLYQLLISDQLGCQFEQWLEVPTAPQHTFTIGGLPDAAVSAGDTLQFSAQLSVPIATIDWLGSGRFSCTDCTEPYWYALPEGRVRAFATDSSGCRYLIDTLLQVRAPYRVYLPTAFSPNSDGSNDTFAPALGSNALSVLAFDIYNRWGGKVFSWPTHSGTPPAWDGEQDGQPADTGPYLYQVTIQFKDGEIRPFSGEFMLMR